MISSAEDLLRSCTIPELREVVIALQRDSSNKQTELQMMVGSRYHDFIQSADHISNMQRNSELMGAHLVDFWQFSQELLIKVKNLIAYSLPTDDNNNLVKKSFVYGIDSGTVWSYLEDCEVGSAALVICKTTLLTLASSKNISKGDLPIFIRLLKSSSLEKLPRQLPYNLHRICQSTNYLTKSLLDDCYYQLLDGSSSSLQKAQALAVLYLFRSDANTDVPPVPPPPPLPPSYQPPPPPQPELRDVTYATKIILSTATVRLEAATSKLEDKGLSPESIEGSILLAVRIIQLTLLDLYALLHPQQTNSSSSSSSGGDDTVPAAAAGYSDCLVTLQVRRILEALEWQLQHCHMTATTGAGSGAGSALDVSPIAKLSLPSTLTFPSPPKYALDSQQLRKTVSKWLVEVEEILSTRCSAALRSLGGTFENTPPAGSSYNNNSNGHAATASATAIARLQQMVWLACSSPSVTATSTSAAVPSEFVGVAEGLHCYSEALWTDTCRHLLEEYTPTSTSSATATATAVQRPSAATDYSSSTATANGKKQTDRSKKAAAGGLPVVQGSQLLWSRVFRTPFLLQLESLLVTSRIATMEVVQSLIFAALREIGVTVAIDPATGAYKIHGLEGGRKEPLISSTYLFMKAETIRNVLEHRIKEMVVDTLVGGGGGGTGNTDESNGALSLNRAARIQCCILIGQILILLRTLSLSLHEKTQTSGGSDSDSDSDSDSALSGLLLLGRLCWILRLRGRFLDDALESPTSPPSSLLDASATGTTTTSGLTQPLPPRDRKERERESSLVSSSRGGQFISEGQLQSAFDIADTDGDGIVTCEEAIEALQAVSIEDADTSTSLPINPLATPTLIFNEFALLCTSLILAKQLRPREHLAEALCSLNSFIMKVWVDRKVTQSIAMFQSTLCQEMGVVEEVEEAQEQEGRDVTAGSSSSSSSLTAVLPFRQSWQLVALQVEDGDNATSSNNSSNSMEIPVSPTHALDLLLFQTWDQLATSFLSIDTVQPVPLASLRGALVSSGRGSGSGRDLADFYRYSPLCQSPAAEVVHLLQGALSTSLLHSYRQLLSLVTTQASRKALGKGQQRQQILSNGRMLSEIQTEERAMQVMLDLAVIQKVMNIVPPTPSSTTTTTNNNNSNHLSTDFVACREQWMDLTDPVDFEIVEDRLQLLADEHCRKKKYLLPNFCPLPQSAAGSTGSLHQRPVKMTTPGHKDTTCLAVPSAPRFALLPLPFGSHLTAGSGTTTMLASSSSTSSATTAGKSNQQTTNATKGTLFPASTLSYTAGLQGTLSLGLSNSLEGLRSNLTGLGNLGLGNFLQSQAIPNSSTAAAASLFLPSQQL